MREAIDRGESSVRFTQGSRQSISRDKTLAKLAVRFIGDAMPETPRRVTLRDVAQAAGCHFTTVSLALRNHPRLPKETCQKVQAVARTLGYVSDPMLAAFSAYRTATRPVGYRATLAWITNHPRRGDWKRTSIFYDYFRAAEARANSLGYKLEEFWIREPGLTSARASQILRARTITGLIIAPQPEPSMTIELDWPQFSAVAIGYSLSNPRLHLVCPHQYRAMRHAMDELHKRDYRRPGLVMLRASDDRVDNNWQAGYMIAQQALPTRDRLPPLLLEQWDQGAFLAWFKRHEPDVIITKFEELIAAVKNAKRRVPRDLGIVFLTAAEPGGERSGVYENPVQVGAAAVDYLIGMIYRNERGVPASPQRLLIESSWVEGAMVRPVPARLQPAASL